MNSDQSATPGTVSQAWPIARRAYRCTSCHDLIDKGQRYYRWTGRSDFWDGLATARECAECCERYGRPIPSALDEERPGG